MGVVRVEGEAEKARSPPASTLSGQVEERLRKSLPTLRDPDPSGLFEHEQAGVARRARGIRRAATVRSAGGAVTALDALPGSAAGDGDEGSGAAAEQPAARTSPPPVKHVSHQPSDRPASAPVICEGVRNGCVASLDNIQLVPVAYLLRRAGHVAPDRWHEFCAAMAKVMAC